MSTPKYFYAIGQFYTDFSQVSDREVTELLQRASQPIAQKAEEDPPAAEKSGAMPQGWRSKFNIDQREVSIELDDASLQGSLAIPVIKVLDEKSVQHIWADFEAFRRAEAEAKAAQGKKP